jgi:uncharacterized protein
MNSLQADQEKLPVENSMDLLILLLYAPGKSGNCGENVEGITRLQKLMFLLQQGLGPEHLVEEAELYSYEPYKMGPYAPDLKKDIVELQSVGIIMTERLEYWIQDDADDADADEDDDLDVSRRPGKLVQSAAYSLSQTRGTDVGCRLWESLPSKRQREMIKFKSFFNSLSLRQLLIFTYRRFPGYAKRSTIKSNLGL